MKQHPIRSLAGAGLVVVRFDCERASRASGSHVPGQLV